MTMTGKRLLLVEDECVSALYLKNILEKFGLEVFPVQVSGESAIQAVREFSPDLIIMDIVLRGEMDGVEAMKIIREENDLPVIYVTGNSDRETLGRAGGMVSSRILIKPVSTLDLEQAIIDVLEMHRMKILSMENKESYKSLFNNMIDAYALHEIQYDDLHNPVDCIYLDINPAFEKITGLTRNIIGCSIRTVLSEDDDYFKIALNYLNNSELTGRFEYYFNSIEKWFEISVSHPGKNKLGCFLLDITERKKNERDMAIKEIKIQTLVALNCMNDKDDQEIIDYARDAAISLTCSRYCYVAFIDHEEGLIKINSRSDDAVNECSIEKKNSSYSLESVGLWAEPFRQGKPVITNNYFLDGVMQKGLPHGHVRIKRHLGIPVIDRGRVVAVVGVANKEEKYNEFDVQQVTPVMEAMWQLLMRKKAERQFKHSQELYHSLIENINDVVCRFDVDMKITYISSMIKKLCGYLPEDVISRDIRDFIWREEPSYDLNDVGENLSGVYELRLLTVEGSLRNVRCSISQIKDEHRISGYVSVITDITDEKLFSREIDANRERLQRIIDNMPVMLVAYDSDMNLILWNRECEKVSGYRADEIIGNPAGLDLLYPEEELMAERNRKRKNRGKTFRNMELEFICKNGMRKIISWSDVSEKYHVSGLSGWSVGIDVTEKKRTQERLKVQLEAANRVMEASGPEEGIGVYFDAALSVSGMDSGLMYIRNEDSSFTCIRNCGFGEDYINAVEKIAFGSECSSRFYQKEMVYGGPDDISEAMKDVSEKEGVLSFSISPVLFREQVLGVFFLASHSKRNLSGLSRAILETIAYQAGNAAGRLQAEKSLKDSVNEKELLLKEIHHRVKNNMQVMISLLSLQYEQLTDEKDRELFVKTENRIRSMAMIHEMLYRAGNLSKINFSDYIHELVDEISMVYRKPEFLISVKIISEDVFLGIDTAIPCGLIINELVTNSFVHAFDDMDGGTIVIDIFVSEGECFLKVMDNGKGFIEEPVFNDTKSLGMSLVSGLTHQIGGTITCDCTAGAGFEIKFPCPDVKSAYLSDSLMMS